MANDFIAYRCGDEKPQKLNDVFPAKDKDGFTSALTMRDLGKRMWTELQVTLRPQRSAWFATLLRQQQVALVVTLREQGYRAQEVDAVLALRPQRLAEVAKRLEAVRAFAALPESPALAAANKRIGNILKKAGEVDAHVNTALLKEDAEKNLYAVMQKLLPESEAQFKAGDYTASLQTLAALRAPVDAFFDDVMVNAEEMDLRLNRQGLLKSLHVAMNRVADLSRLAA